MNQKREMRKNKKMDENTKSLPSTNINWYPGHMAKTKREISEIINLIDVVIEILDARIPKASHNPDMEKLIENKKRLIALNKIDLADEKETAKWVKLLKNKGFAVVEVDANSGKGINNVIKEIETLMAEEKKKNDEKGRVGKSIRVLVMGIPNVGKSSFINRISKKNTMEVGNKPGVTKNKQWIRLSNNIELLDTPGILWPKFQNQDIALNLSFTGTIKDDILPKTEISYNLVKLLIKYYKNNLLKRYKLQENELEEILNNENMEENEKIYDVMCLIARKRGCIHSGGRVDDEKVSNIILDDFRNCKFGKITLEKGE